MIPIRILYSTGVGKITGETLLDALAWTRKCIIIARLDVLVLCHENNPGLE